MIGERVGRYTIVAQLGAGGMGSVYEVEGPDRTRYAMKVPIGEGGDALTASKRFAREANVMQLLDHPNLVRAIDQVVAQGRLYLILELVRGPTLGAEHRRGAVPPRRALAIVRQILDGLEHAHAAGVVHRDLKPDNVVLAEGDHVKILDFGLVKLLDAAAAAIGGDRLTGTGITFGTPEYMAPEQALGRPLDGRVDLYALGVMLFELLAGVLPFAAKDPPAILRAHVATPPPRLAAVRPGTPFELDALVAGALAKNPAARFANAAAMRNALDHAVLSIP